MEKIYIATTYTTKKVRNPLMALAATMDKESKIDSQEFYKTWESIIASHLDWEVIQVQDTAENTAGCLYKKAKGMISADRVVKITTADLN